MQILCLAQKNESPFGFIVFTAEGGEALEFSQAKPQQQNSTNNAAK